VTLGEGGKVYVVMSKGRKVAEGWKLNVWTGTGTQMFGFEILFMNFTKVQG